MNKRLIEYDLPLADISEESAREKNIRHGHPSTLHIWWARRPLASSRATAFAAPTTIPTSPPAADKYRRVRLVIEGIRPAKSPTSIGACCCPSAAWSKI